MTLDFEELDFQNTALGEISLTRRADPRLAGEILYEVELGGEFLMSSRFTSAEIQLAKLGRAASDAGFDRAVPSGLVHAVLLDIDHSPSHWLNPGNGAFYSAAGLRKLPDKLHPGDLFGPWSDDPPDAAFTRLLDAVFQSSQSHIVTFPNPYLGGESANTVYLARKGA